MRLKCPVQTLIETLLGPTQSYNVSDAAGNIADEVARSDVEAPTQPGDITPPVITPL